MFDPRGGYFKAGGVYMPSIVAELGAIIEQHLKMIGLLVDPEMSNEQRKLINEKRAAYETRVASGSKKKSEISSRSGSVSTTAVADITPDLAGNMGESARRNADEEPTEAESASAFPPGATMCHKCNTNSTIMMDGCATCLNCGYSKCG